MSQMREVGFSLFMHFLAVQGKCTLSPKMTKHRYYAGLNVVFLSGGGSFISNTGNVKNTSESQNIQNILSWKRPARIIESTLET